MSTPTTFSTTQDGTSGDPFSLSENEVTWIAIGLGSVGVLSLILIVVTLCCLLRVLRSYRRENNRKLFYTSQACDPRFEPKLTKVTRPLHNSQLHSVRTEKEEERNRLATPAAQNRAHQHRHGEQDQLDETIPPAKNQSQKIAFDVSNTAETRESTLDSMNMKKHLPGLYTSKSSGDILLVCSNSEENSDWKPFSSLRDKRASAVTYISAHDSENSLYGYLPGY